MTDLSLSPDKEGRSECSFRGRERVRLQFSKLSYAMCVSELVKLFQFVVGALGGIHVLTSLPGKGFSNSSLSP